MNPGAGRDHEANDQHPIEHVEVECRGEKPVARKGQDHGPFHGIVERCDLHRRAHGGKSDDPLAQFERPAVAFEDMGQKRPREGLRQFLDRGHPGGLMRRGIGRTGQVESRTAEQIHVAAARFRHLTDLVEHDSRVQVDN